MKEQIQQLLNHVNEKCDDYNLYLNQNIPMVSKRHEKYRGKLKAYQDVKFQIEEISKPKTVPPGKKYSALEALRKAYPNK